MGKGISAIEVWVAVPLALRLVEVNTKTGFSLTAGSYASHATSNQSGSTTLGSGSGTSANATVSSVTTTRSITNWCGNKNSTETINGIINAHLTSATNVNSQRGGTNGDTESWFEVEETF